MSYGSIYLNSWIGNPSTGLQGSVSTFNDLPQPPSEYMGKYFRVVEGSGGFVIAGYRIGGKDPGVYYSNGTTWSIRRDFDASDIAIDPAQYDIITATNLRDGLKELASAVVASSGNPTGTTIAWTGSSSSIPSGYLHCNGQSVSRTTYSALFTVIGTSFGSVDANTFNVPDYRDMFLRGAKTDGTRNVNTYQADEFKQHSHLYDKFYNRIEWASNFFNTNETTGDETNQYSTVATSNTGGSETRPKNWSVHYLIKI